MIYYNNVVLEGIMMNNQKKKLPLGKAPIKYLMRFFVPLMIAFINPHEVEGWFYSSYILTKVRKRTYKYWMIFQNFNPFIIRLPFLPLSSCFLHSSLLIKLIKFLIDHNWYVLLSVDFYYLKSSFYYLQKHFNHSVLLYGYDLQNNIVNLCGYCFDTKIKCVDTDISSFIKAFYSCKHNKVWIYKRRKRRKVKFNKRFFYLGVKGYAKSSCPIEYQIRAKSFSAIFREHYGIDAHIQLERDIAGIQNGEKKDLKLRIYSYIELTQCMSDRLVYLQKNNLLNNIESLMHDFDLLKLEYQKMLNLFIKFELTGNKDLVDKLIAIEKNQITKERYLYKELLDNIEKQYYYK